MAEVSIGSKKLVADHYRSCQIYEVDHRLDDIPRINYVCPDTNEPKLAYKV